MSCPNWKLLVAERDAGGEDPAGWAPALAHMDDCDDCRRRALAADPTLVFRRLPTFAANDAAVDSEVESMRQAVASLRHASRTLGEARHEAPRRSLRLGERARRLAAALLLAGAGLGAWYASAPGEDAPAAIAAGPVAMAPAVNASLPVFEDLGRPKADVYQMGEEDLTVVMVVDETLDI